MKSPFRGPRFPLVFALVLLAQISAADLPRRPPTARLAEKITRDVSALLATHANDRQSERLWTLVRSEVGNLLHVLWRNGELLGTRAEEAYFVRCDRTTMTAQDIAAGRLKVQVGYAPAKPAEFQIAQFEHAVLKPLASSSVPGTR